MAVRNRADAQAELERVVPTTDPPTLDADDIAACLDAAKVVDPEGRPPTHEDYVETIDANYAIAEAFDLKAIRLASTPQLAEFSAEGARFKRSMPDFYSLANYYRSKSTAGGDGSGISVIELQPQIPDALRPRSTRVDRR